MNLYKKGDKVRFIQDEKLGILSGKTGIIEEMVDNSAVDIQDHKYHSTHVYKVYVQLHGIIWVLDGYIKPAQQMTDAEKLTALISYIKDAERYHLDNARIGSRNSADKSMAVQDIICFIENELGIECEQLPSKCDKQYADYNAGQGICGMPIHNKGGLNHEQMGFDYGRKQ